MRNYNFIILTLVLGLFIIACDTANEKSKDNHSSTIEDTYYGLMPPGMVAIPLASDSISEKSWGLGEMHGQDMEEYYFVPAIQVPLRPIVISFRKENRVWKKYEFYETGGDTLYSRDKYIERTDTGWSKIKSLGAPFDSIPIMRLTASLKGTLVFDEWSSDGSGLLRYSRLVNGKREAPKPFSKEINKGQWEAHPFIAPDESYIIWDSEREGGYGDGDMYISFKQPDGTWGAAINFGDMINTDGEDGGGYVTPDGKYLSFCPRCQPPYDRMWVDAKIIETLRPK